MKITICDVHNIKGEIVKTNRYFKVKGKRLMRLDVCDKCYKKYEKIPFKEYKKLVAKVNGWSNDFMDSMFE